MDSNKQSNIILSILWPFAGLVSSIKNWRQPWAMNVFWVVCIYLGAITIYHPTGTVLGEGADGGRYALALIQMHSSSTTLGDIFSSYLKDSHCMDLYQPLTTFLVSRVTDNGHVLFAVFAFVFGFFYSRNIWYILNKINGRDTRGAFLLIALFFLVCTITNVNGVRMWTALHVFVYAVMPYLLDNDKSKLGWLALTPLIHFSYLYVAVLTVVFIVLLKKHTPSNFVIIGSVIAFTASLAFNTLNFDAVSNALQEYSPESYEGRISMYVNEGYANQRAASSSQNNWYVAANSIISKWAYAALLVLITPIMLRQNKQDEESTIQRLFIYALLLGTFANVSALIPSGGRFQRLAEMFQLPMILLVLTDDKYIQLSLRSLFRFGKVVLLIPFVVQVRLLFNFYGLSLVFGNFITTFLYETNTPLIEYVKIIF